jgi:hypothetical protein
MVNSDSPVIATGGGGLSGDDVFKYFGKHTLLDGTD